jgi:hypothetical protein
MNFFTKNNSEYLYNSVTDYNLKYKKINNLYLNEGSLYNVLNYGSHKQLQYTNLKANLNKNHNFFEKKSLQKFMNYTDFFNSKLKDYYDFYNLTKTTPLLNKIRFENYDFYANSRYKIVENVLWEGSYSSKNNFPLITSPESNMYDMILIMKEWYWPFLLNFYSNNTHMFEEFTSKVDEMYENRLTFNESPFFTFKYLDFYSRYHRTVIPEDYEPVDILNPVYFDLKSSYD